MNRAYSIDQIIGIDFTSRPTPRKPITAAQCTLIGNRLTLEAPLELPSFEAFEHLLERPGPWLAGMDCPFAQPRKLIENLNLPRSWPEYVAYFSSLGKDGFVAALEAYKAPRRDGDKEHRRAVDTMAKSISPQKLYGVPVGKMFFEAARRLLDSPLNVPLLRETDDNRTALEAYPKLVVQACVGSVSYKSDDRAKQTEVHRANRQAIVDRLLESVALDVYGIEVDIDASDAGAMVDDPSGDRLDALLCAVQTAWACRSPNHGIPGGIDALEGWIVDPSLKPSLGQGDVI